MHYVFAVLRDRLEAEAAYTALETAGLPLSSLSILGKGYKSADEFGLIDPMTKAKQQIRLMATWLVPFGFLGGVGFSVLSGLHTFAWAGEIGNHLIGGVLGAMGGAMGSFFVGGGVGVATGAGDALPYRNRLAAGKYLIVVRGNEAIARQATPILQRFSPENLQGYVDGL